MIWASIIINVFLRLIYSLYGYIATEEGSLLYNQQLAYSGQIPFIDYDAWSSLFHDYLLGWHQLLLGTSILTQRLIGILLSLPVFLLTLRISQRLTGHQAATWTAIFLALGSIRYVYSSTVPYSEQFMTLAIVLSLALILSKQYFLTLVLAMFATLVRSQALPITILIYFYVLRSLPFSRWWRLTLGTLVLALVALLPWWLKDPAQILWAFFWPLKADQILLYQQGISNITLSHLVNFVLETARDYGLLLSLTLAGLVSGIWPSVKSKTKAAFMWLLLAIITSQLFVSLAHRPPYASYLAPLVPLLAIVAAYTFTHVASKLSGSNTRFFYLFTWLLLLLNFVLFPHAQFMKTSIRSLTNTPHDGLRQIADYLTTVTQETDEVLSFYLPVSVAAKRQVPADFARDRFSLTPMPEAEARLHHLATPEMLLDYIATQKAAAIVLTDKTSRVFGTTAVQQSQVIAQLNQHYQLARSFSEIRFVEDPKTLRLDVYLRR